MKNFVTMAAINIAIGFYSGWIITMELTGNLPLRFRRRR